MIISGVEVYADIVFLINLAMDFIILLIVSKIHKKRASPLRIFAGAATASLLYCIVIFVPILSGWLNIFSSLAIISIGILITFAPKNIKDFFKLMAFTYITSFAIGGLGLGLFYFTNIGSTVGNYLNFTVKNFSYKLLLASTAGAYIIIKLTLVKLHSISIKRQSYMRVKVSLNDNSVEFDALVDTGNSLVDPLTHYPVIVAEFLHIKEFLPDSIKHIYYGHNENNVSRITEYAVGTHLANRIRLIPFCSVGADSGILVGFKPDIVEIFTESDKKITCENVIIGIYNRALSKEGIYQALINPELISQRRLDN